LTLVLTNFGYSFLLFTDKISIIVSLWFSYSRVESYVTTDGQSASLSWNKAPIWGLRRDFYYCHTVAGLSMWRALSLTRGRICRLQLLLTLVRAVIFGLEYRKTRDHILLYQIRDFPFCRLLRLAGQRWKFMIPEDKFLRLQPVTTFAFNLADNVKST
jgi:hypothetical protein